MTPRQNASSRTKDRARSVLIEQLAASRPRVQDDAAREILTANLAVKVLNVAWRHQFDRDRRTSIAAIREIIDLAIAERDLGIEG